MNRREFIQTSLATLMMWQLPSAFARQAYSDGNVGKNLIWVVLRGALDSLHTIVPQNDKDLATLRPTLYPAIKGLLLPLDQQFGFHPKLANLHQMFQQKQCLPIVAVSSGYQKRSHFEGQDYLETGQQPYDTSSGWLARALDIKKTKALALNNATPVSLRGSSLASTWYPSSLRDADDELYSQMLKMYQGDGKLLSSLEKGLELKGFVDNKGFTKEAGKFVSLCQNCGDLMTKSEDINCAMLEMGGWDTHNRQVGRLGQKLAALDTGLFSLKQKLGKQWDNTLVVVATEFGRTARENGTQGTDHGTGSALLLLGGKVNGGQVLGEWPGLKPEQLFENRDLKPTTNSFSWLAAALNQHWQLSVSDLSQVFPGVKPYADKLLVS